jgi:glycosyltransferase involved in cell wall biosynthesis
MTPVCDRHPADRPLRICLTSRAPFFGGAEQAGLRLLEGLGKAGHEVLAVLGEDNEVARAYREADIETVVSPLPQTDKRHWWSYRTARTRLRSILRRFDPHIIHANDLPTHQITSDAARGMTAPCICHQRFIYSGEAIDWLNKHGADLHLFISPAFETEMCRRSSRLAAEPRALVPDGLPLPPKPTAIDQIDALRELDLPEDRLIVTFTGQVIERKGIADLLHAWAVLPLQQKRKAKLVIVGDDLAGDGAYRRRMKKLAGTLGVGAYFTGFQNNVDRWLVASDIVVLPSHEEPLGLTIMEAMAYGRACVGTMVGGIPSMISHESTGLLVPPADPQALGEAIGRLIIDSTLRQRLGAAGRQRCSERFSIDVHVANVVAQYHRALGAQPLRQTA